MKAAVVLIIAFLAVSSQGNGFDESVRSPDCVPKCWNNSKIVTICMNEKECLCKDAGFQATVFRCLYSQCQTAQFGSALHFTLIECVDHKVQNSMVVPKLIGQHDLRKRVEHYPGFGSMVSSASVIQSSQRRYASVSASTSARPTRSAAYGALRALNNSASQWTVSSAFGVTTTLIKITNTPLVS